MRILLTNDDGIDSQGILLLAKALRTAGHRIFVVAPVTNCSGVSHSLSFLNRPCRLNEHGKDTWSCEGTPVDCVVIATLGGIPELCFLDKSGNRKAELPVDIVVSGINRGANLGTDIVYSGTASAARQGALINIPSVAFSLVEADGDYSVWNWDMAVEFIVEHFDRILAYWKPDSFVNVNIPNKQEKPLSLVHAFPAFRCYNDRIDVYRAPSGQQYCFANAGKIGMVKRDSNSGIISDYEAVEKNCASISEIYIHPLLLESVIGGG